MRVLQISLQHSALEPCMQSSMCEHITFAWSWTMTELRARFNSSINQGLMCITREDRHPCHSGGQ